MEVEFTNLKEDDDFLPRLEENGGDVKQMKKTWERALKSSRAVEFDDLEDNEQ